MQRQRMERLGIEGLDNVLKGGVPEKSILLIEGTPGIGKDVAAYHFLYAGLKEGEACAYVFARKTVGELEEEFAAYGMEIDPSRITWIDASESQLAAGPNVMNCNLTELFTVSAAIKKFLADNRKMKIRVVFDILSPALMSNSPLEVYKFFSSLVNEFKKYSATAMVLIEEGMHDPQIVVSVEQLCDYVIDMKAYEHDWDIRTMLRIKKTRTLPPPLQYFRFAVTGKGIAVSV